MTLYNPSLRAQFRHSHLQDERQRIKSQLRLNKETVQGLIEFVSDEHLSVATFRRYWRQEPRAVLTIRVVGQALEFDLADAADAVRDVLYETADAPLAEFQAYEAAHLFATIDAIEPDEVSVGDGRAAAEKFQYAAEARTALLKHALAVLNQRYPGVAFANLSEATTWVTAFAALLQETEEVVAGTQQMLYDQATAMQSYLDTIRNRFELLEEQAHTASMSIRGDWRLLLENAENDLLDLLALRHDRLAELTFVEMKEVHESGWLDAVVRAAPRLSSFILALAGGAALLAPVVSSTGSYRAISANAMGDGIRNAARPFPVLPRHNTNAVQGEQRVQDEVSRFFSMQPRPRGRHSLQISNEQVLQRVLGELERYGYPKDDVLALLGLRSVEALPGPISLDVRWSQGGRPLLLPPPEHNVVPNSMPAVQLADTKRAAITVPTTDRVLEPVRFEGTAKPGASLLVYHVDKGDTLAALATRYDTTIAQFMSDNHLSNDLLTPGQMILVRVSGPMCTLLETPASTVAAGNRNGEREGRSSETASVAAQSSLDVLVARYGSTVFPSLEAMPSDLRTYFSTTVQEVADFFQVRPGDIIGILQAENNNAGLRIHQPAISSAGARGVAQIVPRTWNGWASPETMTHSRDLREIERYGGLGFDWSMREEWRAWKMGQTDGAALAAANADPDNFENSISGIARHLLHFGLTRDRASSDPVWYKQQLADAISVYNSGRPLSEAASFRQSAANAKTTGQYVTEAIAVAEATPVSLVAPAVPLSEPLREAYQRQMDILFGVALTEEEIAKTFQESVVAADVAAGKVPVEEGARLLVEQVVHHYLSEGRAALEEGLPLPWPFIYDQESLSAQSLAVEYIGHLLPPPELQALLERSGGDTGAMREELTKRGDARLFQSARHRFDQLLQRSARQQPVWNHEVAAIVQPAVAGYNPFALSDDDIHQTMEIIEEAIRSLPEYREFNRVTQFRATPLVPMPVVFKQFGAKIDYQKGGQHTGIDVANPKVNGEEPLLYAVEDGTVVHVGPLYCNRADACRGGHAIVIDHGDNVYTLYSHNSVALVQVGQPVRHGEVIGRQGNEGYSFGSHLHFEVHTGAPFTGNWQQPFNGGQFEDPLSWLP